LGAESKPPAVRAGDRLKIRASTWNAVTDLLGDRRTGGPTFLTDTETRILVRNDTGGDVDRFGVVKIGDVLITPDLNEDEYANRRAFVGESPAAGAAFAVTQQPIPAGECGWAVVLGVTTCTLNVADAADTHAGPAAGDVADLATGATGPARILYKESGTGAGKKAKVLLTGTGAGGGEVLQIQAGASNSFGYPARVQTWSAAAGSWTDASATEVRVEDPNGSSWAEDDYVVAMFLGLSAGGVACYAAVPPGAGGSTTPYILDHPLSSTSSQATSQTREFTVLPYDGYWLLTLNVDINLSSTTRLYYGLYEVTYGGGPSAGSVEFIGPGADNSGVNYNIHIGGGTPRSTSWRLHQNQSSGLGEAWTATTYARTDAADVKLGVWGKVTSPITFTFVGAADYTTSLTAHRIGDL
jgi:hypothetical protein